MTSPDHDQTDTTQPPDAGACPVCGHAVEVISSGEGTNHYRPIEAAARRDPEPGGLDRERLARALQSKRGGRMSDNRGWAEDIAAEYARLAATNDGK